MLGRSKRYPRVGNGTSTCEEPTDSPPLSSLVNRRRGWREGDPEEYKNELSKRRLSMKRRMSEENGLKFIGLSISLSDINLKILESTWDVGGDYLSDVEIDYDDSKHKSSKSVISGESQSLLPTLTVPDSELMYKLRPPRTPLASTKSPISGSFVFGIYFVAASLFCGAGLWYNGGNKYIRLQGMDDSTAQCISQWANVLEGKAEGTAVCCTQGDIFSWGVCRAAAVKWTTLYMGKIWVAWFLPIVAFIINTSFQTSSPASLFNEAKKRHKHRLALYIVLIVWRMFLYLWPKWLMGERSSRDIQACWYAEYTSSGTCRLEFDFSDHVVLFLGQYVSIQTFETFAAMREKCKRWLTVLVTIMVSICALGGMFDTIAFFHSRQESIAAFILVSVTVYLPLWLLMSGKLASRHQWLDPFYYIQDHFSHRINTQDSIWKPYNKVQR
eukprot:314530_1